MKTTVTRRLQFCAGHRLLEHEGKCAHVHGHNYVAHITCTADKLDDVGRVIDFSVIKKQVGGWIDENWDHQFVVCAEDEAMISFLEEQGQPHYTLPANPTAENMADELWHWATELLGDHGIAVESVELEETENCRVEVKR